MLFDKRIEPCCAYCRRGSRISEDEVVCTKRGIVPADEKCRKFVYDPFQREPDRPILAPSDPDNTPDFTL